MEIFYFTFGSGHHDTRGRSLLGYYVKIEAKDYADARRIMFEHFGEKWSFQYPEDKFMEQIERFNLEELFIDGVELCCGIEQIDYLKLRKKVEENHEVN